MGFGGSGGGGGGGDASGGSTVLYEEEFTLAENGSTMRNTDIGLQGGPVEAVVMLREGSLPQFDVSLNAPQSYRAGNWVDATAVWIWTDDLYAIELSCSTPVDIDLTIQLRAV